MTIRTPSHLLLQFSMSRDRFDIEIDTALDLNEPVAIFGPSGSGKTSILRAIAGLERAGRGRIEFDGERWQDDTEFIPAWQRNVGYVFQDARLFPHLDVDGNLELAQRAARSGTIVSKPEVIEKLNIGKMLGRSTSSLSGGEAQRVAIARTLLAQPRLLLMDEPVSSLDASSRRETIEYIAAVTSSLGLPLLYVTHDAGEVARLAGTTIMLDEGRIIAAGRTPDVFAHTAPQMPGTRSVSILAANVADAAGELRELRIGEQTVRLPTPSRSNDERVQLRIFASDVVIARRRIEDTSIRNVLSGTIEEITTLSPGTAEVRIDIGGQILKAQVTADAVNALQLCAGEEIYAMIKSVALGDQTRKQSL